MRDRQRGTDRWINIQAETDRPREGTDSQTERERDRGTERQTHTICLSDRQTDGSLVVG